MSNAHKILLVTNESADKTVFEKALSAKGFDVTNAASGEDALWMLEHDLFQCVFIDAVMRGMSGLEVAEEIEARGLDLPVVAMAEASFTATVPSPGAVGVTEFLRKPLTPEQIADAALRVLHMSEADLLASPQGQGVEDAPAATGSSLILRIRNVILFLLAPIVGLVYLLSFPVVGIGMVVWSALKKKRAAQTGPAVPVKSSLVKTIAMVPATFLIGVVFALAGPIFGIGVLLWFGFEAWGKAGVKAMSA